MNKLADVAQRQLANIEWKKFHLRGIFRFHILRNKSQKFRFSMRLLQLFVCWKVSMRLWLIVSQCLPERLMGKRSTPVTATFHLFRVPPLGWQHQNLNRKAGWRRILVNGNLVSLESEGGGQEVSKYSLKNSLFPVKTHWKPLLTNHMLILYDTKTV